MLSDRKKLRRKPAGPLGPPERPKVPAAAAIRTFLIGALAVAGAVYALWRHYEVPRTPMLVPVPSATELPAPELVPSP